MEITVTILEGIKIFLPSMNKQIGRVTHLTVVATRIRMTPLRIRNQTEELGRIRRRISKQTVALLILEMMTALTMKMEIFQMRKRTIKTLTQ